MQPSVIGLWLLFTTFINTETAGVIEYPDYGVDTTTEDMAESSGSLNTFFSGDGEGSGDNRFVTASYRGKTISSQHNESTLHTRKSHVTEVQQHTTDTFTVNVSNTRTSFVISTTPYVMTSSKSAYEGVLESTSFHAITDSILEQGNSTADVTNAYEVRSIYANGDIEGKTMNSTDSEGGVGTTADNFHVKNTSAIAGFRSTVSLFEEIQSNSSTTFGNSGTGIPNVSTVANESWIVTREEVTSNSANSGNYSTEYMTSSTVSSDGNPKDSQICGNYVCGVGYSCVKNRCLSACESTHPYCLNRGICKVLPNGRPGCWCPSSAEWWFRGERCEIEESNLKVALIAGGLGFLVLTLFVAIIICMSRLAVQSKLKNQIIGGKLIETSTLKSHVTRNDRAFLNTSDLLTPVPPTFDTSSQEDEMQQTNTNSVQYWKLGTITKEGEARTRFTSKSQTEIESIDKSVSATSFRRICSGERREQKYRPESMTHPRGRNKTEVQYETSGIIL